MLAGFRAHVFFSVVAVLLSAFFKSLLKFRARDFSPSRLTTAVSAVTRLIRAGADVNAREQDRRYSRYTWAAMRSNMVVQRCCLTAGGYG